MSQTCLDSEYKCAPETQVWYAAIKSGTEKGTETGASGFEENSRRPLWLEELLRCWRGEHCLAAEEVDFEVPSMPEIKMSYKGRAGHAGYQQRADTRWYSWQEGDGPLEGKRKMRFKVGSRVAQAVDVEDRYLPPRVEVYKVQTGNGWAWRWGVRQGKGKDLRSEQLRQLRDAATAWHSETARKWCGWCERVVLGVAEEEEVGESTRTE